ncbi:hypothetical protein JCM3774_006671 [Rhodotorula dairenensis]
MSGPSSYSSLLRRSKLASWNPQIDQVYTASSANRARANYGLKRPLPALAPAAGARSPFVRITDLDSPERRTSYRRATREQQYTKKWLEVDAGLASEALVDRGALGYAYGDQAHRRWERLPVQSRFVAPGTPGAIQPLDHLSSRPSSTAAPAAAAAATVPNFFALTPAKFDRFLAELASRRDEFRQFVLAEAKKLAEQTGGAVAGLDDADFDLYAHAQRNPLELTRLVERFLRRSGSAQSTPPPTTSSPLSSLPVPHVHPTLALQYATPTPLESALAAPVPGRLLGPAPDGGSRGPGSFNSSRWNNRADVYASVLSQVAPVPANATGGAAETNFFPDVEGHRSNVPGRAHFRLAPTVNPVPYANQTAITLTKIRLGSHEFRPPTAEYEPALLKLRSVRLNPTVVTSAPGGPSSSSSSSSLSSSSPSPAARPGSPAYSGALPRDLAGSSSAAAGAKARSLSDLIGTNALSSARSREMAAGRQHRRQTRSPEEQAKWLEKRERYLGSAAAAAEGGRGAGAGGAGAGKRKRQGSQGRAEKTKQLMAALDALLVEK